VWVYLRRGQARKSIESWGPKLAAVAGTFSSLLLPYLGSGAPPTQATAGQLVLAIGLGFSLWSMSVLDRSFSIVPQARELVQRGPYARVRHPLYLGEIVATLGMAIMLGGWATFAGWLAIVALQSYRAVQEEKLLGEALPGYREYQGRTARIIPGVF
jgi:protein-S-isoprenylcysteine O-methyltransferase Ste14